ncbi:MAG TPA: sigma-54-dependent Fis family transcriptional regulator, partial [Proteobacteria bacterium]|nr:sigma-54-dependent Fis family transcriptional regulator [Pseudomonadota bacterium]
YKEIVGNSFALKRILDQIEYIKNTKTSVLITGDTGTGKELIARDIHLRSIRNGGPFIPVHCASLPESLMESELFGHEKGAFTGAYRMKQGCFELADEGSIFLDEIAELSLLTQSKLLRVLQEGEFIRVGGTEKIRVDVRVITATNQNLKEMLGRKKFREDLYYRINVVHFHLPPLRERSEDIPYLIDHFFLSIKKELNLPVEEINPEAITIMQKYLWPGNIRELKNVLERVLVLHGFEKDILPSHLPLELLESPSFISLRRNDMNEEYSLQESVNNFERELIETALERTEGNQTQAARLLNTTRRILRYRVEKLKL